MQQKIKDTIKLVLDIENTDLLFRKRLNIPLDESKRLRHNIARNNKSTLLGKEIEITDPFWYRHSLKEIFLEDTYKFKSTSDTPVILDCGANIGLSAIYFKRLYPKCKLIVFEADTNIFAMMKRNLKVFEYNDVELHNKAVWKEETVLQFASNGALGGALDITPSRSYDREVLNAIPAIRLKDYLTTEIDLLKMDIEGAEYEVLNDCRDSLQNVKQLFVEYHSAPGKKQELTGLLQILDNSGFRIYIKEAWNNLPLPFMHTDYKPFWDLQLNIFGYREQPYYTN